PLAQPPVVRGVEVERLTLHAEAREMEEAVVVTARGDDQGRSDTRIGGGRLERDEAARRGPADRDTRRIDIRHGAEVVDDRRDRVGVGGDETEVSLAERVLPRTPPGAGLRRARVTGRVRRAAPSPAQRNA